MPRQPAQLDRPREAAREPFCHWHIVILRNMGTAFMPLRRLIVWIGLGPRQPVPPATPDVDWEGALDLVEFGRLLGSGKSECKQASKIDPSIAWEINNLARRSASGPRADSQAEPPPENGILKPR